jgi:hypothetical protein
MLKNNKILRGPFSIKIPFISFLFLLIIMACEQPKSGCTDIRATNFDVTAAKTDITSCVFPKLVFQVSYIVGDKDSVGLKFDSIYFNTNVPKQSFKIINAATYLSDFQLLTSDGMVFKTKDSITLYRQKDTINALNSFAMIGKNNGYQFTIGTFEAVGKTFAKCRFNIGLMPEINKTDPTKMTSGPLSIRPDSMYNRATKNYIFNKIIIASGVNFKDTLSVEMTTLSPIELTQNLPTKEGADAVIKLQINYLQLFNGVNFTDPKNITSQKIVDNATKVFSLK